LPGALGIKKRSFEEVAKRAKKVGQFSIAGG